MTAGPRFGAGVCFPITTSGRSTGVNVVPFITPETAIAIMDSRWLTRNLELVKKDAEIFRSRRGIAYVLISRCSIAT